MPQAEIAGRMAARGWPWTGPKVSLTESGKRGISMDEVADLCSSLEAPFSDFLNIEGLDVTDEVAFRAKVLTKAADPWGFDTPSVLKEATRDAKRAETLRRIEGRVARAILGSDNAEHRADIAARSEDTFGRDVLAQREHLVGEFAVMAEEAMGEAPEPHVLRRDATLHIIKVLSDTDGTTAATYRALKQVKVTGKGKK